MEKGNFGRYLSIPTIDHEPNAGAFLKHEVERVIHDFMRDYPGRRPIVVQVRCLAAMLEECTRCHVTGGPGELRPPIGTNAPLWICHACLPPQWTCPHCGYGEYKNRDDWQVRFADHLDYCPMRDRPSAGADVPGGGANP